MLTGVPTVCRRQTDTLHVAQLWSAIEHIRDTRQVANFDRISHWLQREHDVLECETKKLLRFATKEQLIQKYQSVTRKGDNAGTWQNGYRIPDVELDFVCVTCFSLSHCSESFHLLMIAFNQYINITSLEFNCLSCLYFA